jgi:hypothetical protein
MSEDGLKATAHALLLEWYTGGEHIRARYLHAAAHHANEAARLGRGISRKGHAAPSVLFFTKHVLLKFTEMAPEFYALYGDAMAVEKEATERFTKSTAKEQTKRLNDPNRYKCANPQCGISANHGKLLPQCKFEFSQDQKNRINFPQGSGKCDADKKPSYCSKACQKVDWKNHKPFCAPGMPCSVIDTSDNPSFGGSGKGDSLQVPIRWADGKTTYVSSETMSPQELRDFRNEAQKHPHPGSSENISNLNTHMELFSIQGRDEDGLD